MLVVQGRGPQLAAPGAKEKQGMAVEGWNPRAPVLKWEAKPEASQNITDQLVWYMQQQTGEKQGTTPEAVL